VKKKKKRGIFFSLSFLDLSAVSKITASAFDSLLALNR